ncbi:hypothetical protein FF38_09048 [Lucilia cuprina]|uniref:Uncharacterized protein n=1 Tax=Lucilia cuprina TaxID=7375 RepID=A0A0L0BNB0_LUCCU|nr:hypothetical protein FF38_09048 [Lucilia cuprina]
METIRGIGAYMADINRSDLESDETDKKSYRSGELYHFAPCWRLWKGPLGHYETVFDIVTLQCTCLGEIEVLVAHICCQITLTPRWEEVHEGKMSLSVIYFMTFTPLVYSLGEIEVLVATICCQITLTPRWEEVHQGKMSLSVIYFMTLVLA